MSDRVPTNDQDSRFHRLRRGSLWIVVGRSLGMAIVFINMVLLAKWLSASDFSAHVLTMSIVTLSSVAAMLGLNYLVCRLVSAYRAVDDHHNAGRSVWLVFVIGTLSSLIVSTLVSIGCYFYADPWFSSPEIGQMCLWIGLWILMLAISQIIAETYRGLHNLFAAALLAGVSGGLIANGLFMIGIIAFYASGNLTYFVVVKLGTISFLIPVVISGVTLVFAWARQNAQPSVAGISGDIRPVSAAAVFQQALPIMYLNFAALGFDKAGQLIAGAFGSSDQVNVFEATWLLAFLPMIPLTMLGLSISSTISEMYAKKEIRPLEQMIKYAATISLLISTPLICVLIVFSSPILSLTFGESFASGGLALSVFCVVQFARNWMGPCDVVLVMTGKQMIALLCFVCAAPILLLGPWAVESYGLVGLSVVVSLAILVSRTLQYFAIVQTLGINPHADFKRSFLTELTEMIRGRRSVGLANSE